jgi:eukaryotic-like serine/threonine-protein kinase
MANGYAAGDLIDNRYRVAGVLGRGGHGVVYLAEDEMLGSQVAIKCLSSALAEDASFKVRMGREARAMGALSGTSATQIFAFQKSNVGELYIVMERLAGRDFGRYLDEIEGHGSKLQPTKMLDLLTPIAATLEKAHALGIIHRDIKPGNIFILDDNTRGGVRLLDFGLAKDLKAAAFTQEGMIAGSPGYIAPEIWRGKAHEVDQRIDVYSLGVVIFRALAGRQPFDPRESLDRLLYNVTRGQRPSLIAVRPDLPRMMDDWVQKALAIDKDDRFMSVNKMWTSLRSILEDTRSRGAPDLISDIPPSVPWDIEVDVDIEEEAKALPRVPRP